MRLPTSRSSCSSSRPTSWKASWTVWARPSRPRRWSSRPRRASSRARACASPTCSGAGCRGARPRGLRGGRPARLVTASADEAVAADLQRRRAGPALRLYTNRDVIGVELAGALKNVMAIATGLVDGLDLGENARAALITRGLAEIVRLGVARGAQPTTFAGLAGLGDLVLTCTGSQSRNHALGRDMARGRSLRTVEAGTPMVAEGVRTVSSALRMAREAGVAMPIFEEEAAVLFDGKAVAEALASLLPREPRPEEERARHA